MKVLITGAKGQLGIELNKQFKAHGGQYEIISSDYDILDITKFENVRVVISQYKPDVVINCAAYTAVDLAESEAENAYKVNALGPKNIAIVCEELGVKLVHISTDYIFDGSNINPRRENDEVGPQSIYGKTKLEGEIFVREYCKRHFIIRTAWLYGEGNNFVRTMLKMSKLNSELDVVGDQFGSPTYTVDLARIIINLIHTEYYGIYHATSEGECSWYDFACEIFRLMEIDIKVNKVTSEQFVRPAKRPKYAVLDNFNLKLYGLNSFRTWQEALADYLDQDKPWQQENL